MADGAGPLPQEAIDYLAAKKLKVGFDYRDVWREEHAGMFTVAKMSQLDMLSDTRDSLVEALRKGQTLRAWSKQITPELQRRGWWGVQEMTDPLTRRKGLVQLGSPRRLKTIYEANLRSARAAGQWERAQRTATTHPYLLYQLGPSARHRPQHVAWAGTLLPIEDEFWRYAYPPNGYNCKCWVRQVSKVEYRRLRDKGYQDPLAPQVIDSATGLPTGHRELRLLPVSVESPRLEWRNYVNKRTGEVERVPEGIDPGWDTNPGIAARRQAVARQFMQSVNRAPAAAGAEAMAQVLPTIQDDLQREYRDWAQTMRTGTLPDVGARRTVGAMSPAIVRAMRDKLGTAPATAGLTIEQRQVKRLLGGASKDARTGLRDGDVLNLVRGLANPKAVIWERGEQPSLLYVLTPWMGDPRPGYRVVRIALARADGKINAIRDIALANAAELQGAQHVRLDDGDAL